MATKKNHGTQVQIIMELAIHKPLVLIDYAKGVPLIMLYFLIGYRVICKNSFWQDSQVCNELHNIRGDVYSEFGTRLKHV